MEVYFENDFANSPSEVADVLAIVVNAYNLLEPEHSREFPLVKLDILLP